MAVCRELWRWGKTPKGWLAPGRQLRRSDPNSTRIQRRRGGPGFGYLGPDAAVIKDPQTPGPHQVPGDLAGLAGRVDLR